uniref:ABC transporter domain-containing protein n=2 Tax=Panagrolaimus sp. JU765 TaxID=591449 RepID=A0AC34Q5V6_9BILA
MLGISVAKDAAVEKGNSIHTYMMLMGMPRWTYNCAHLISAVVKIWIVAVIAGGGFLFVPGYNASKVHKGDKSEKPGSLKKELKKELFEEEYDSAPVGIEISDVTKKFGTLKVLNHVSFKAFENQVTALLGHNGAGKSTLFGCLTGFVTPTSGSVIVKEKALIGFCPQWDPLFPLLTVVEHLEFYSQLKTGKYDPEEIETVLTKVELENARSTLAMNLSGGMKRKLTVGMAMIGGSQILLLDEPTAGMDPLARRNVINIVNALKQGKTVLLTTHYMDEAELLSDRIIIMAKGTLMCNGSADFLKKKLSTGFILTIVFQHDMKNTDKLAQDILQVVQKHVPDSLIDGPIGNQFTILLPFGSQRKFPDLFGEIESKKNELMIGSFGISANTLEQIFIKNNYPTAMFSIQNAIANEFKRNGKNITAKFEIYKYNNVLEDKVSFKLSLPIFLMVFPVFIVSFQIFLYHSEVRRFTVQLYRLTGMSKLLYWSVAYIGDFLYCYFFILLMLMFFVVKTVLTTAYFWISFFALIFATICLLTQAYAAAKYVKKVSTAFILFIFIHFYVALLIAGIIEFIFLVSNPQSKAKNIVCALPTFVLPMSFFFKLCVASMMFKTADLSEFIPSFVILVFTTVLHIFSMFLPAIIENMKRKRLQRQAYVVEEQHPDVVAEDLKATTSIEEFTILCRRLRKVYDKKVAVCSLSLAIPEGECFGLLGANGAGKSTSFNMITGSLEPTSGDAFVLGSDVKNKPKFGFCPQSDAVLPDLTVWETLKLFARLSGRQKQDQCVEILLQLLQLKHRANKIVKNCSGGEKRRLSVGVAILTNSQVIMLDEPTAGIDPKTRRQVWDLLMAMRISGTSIVLSSHSMEECETLCTRIGFLSKGVLKAIGTSQHLKSVFGNTFTLKLMLEEIDLDIYNKTNQDVQALFSAEPTKTPPNSIFLTFSIPKKGDSSWTTMYRQVIDFVDRNPYIKDFALTETTLEEVFVQTTQTENDDKKN